MQLCSYSEAVSNPTWTRKPEDFREDTGNVLNRDTMQTQKAVARSYVTKTELMSNSNKCSSHRLSAEATTAEPDARSHKRSRSDGSSSLRPSEVTKRQRYGEYIGSICESSQHRNRENASMAAEVSGVPQTSPPSDDAGLCSRYWTDESSDKSSAGGPAVPQAEKWIQNIGPGSSSLNAQQSSTKLLLERLPRRTIDLTVQGVEALRRAQSSKDCTLPPLASPLASSTKSADSEKISLSPIKDLIKDLDDPGVNSASLRRSFRKPMAREPIFPEILETRRWGFVKGSDDTTEVLVASKWHHGPVLKPFDNACYEDNALE